MQWHLDYTPTPLTEKISYGKPIVMTGSCFAEEIGTLMANHKLDVCLNPNGIVFNPLSIIKYLQRVLTHKRYVEDELIEHEGLWHSWDHHGVFSNADKTRVLDDINSALSNAHRYLLKADWLIITLGSAHAYVLNANKQVVANCHKVPANTFTKKLLPVEDIVTAFDNFIYQWRHINPGGKILLTVSPVRYKKDGLVENNLSKAILLQSVHHLVNKYPAVYYFPAYELVIDVLRDYRFYKEDMVHPNTQAVNYVWEQFITSCLDKEAQALLQKIHPILQASKHRPFHTLSEEHQKFKETIQLQMLNIEYQYPYIRFEKEKHLFKT